MIFTEFRFLIFFLIVFCVYWGLQHNTIRKIWLLLCSYTFYAAWDWRFLSLIIASTMIDYTVGIMLSRTDRVSQRKAWLIVSLVANLGFLGFFKYYNFFVESASKMLDFIGLSADLQTLNIILPVGISFYTFQTLSYSVDIYLGKLKTTKNLLDLAVYVAFFPQLVAGPIVRASTFIPQLLQRREFGSVDLRACLILFLIGFIKKACISDNLAPVVDQYFDSPEIYSSLSAWAAVLSYAVQIYCDFSGYSDMAIACAGILGYELCLNFDFPYFSSNITEFWRRWHISLSTWLRDYLYIPLGGNRGQKIFTYKNLMFTMLLGGLWHGASWNFVIWGGLHGLALIIHREWSRYMAAYTGFTKIRTVLGSLLTFYWVCIAWILFRSVDLQSAIKIVRSFVFFNSTGTQHFGIPTFGIVVLLGIIHWVGYQGLFSEWWRRLSGWNFAVFYGFSVSVVIPFMSTSYAPFIYFQF